jgi:hypothetical protein
MNVLAAMEDTMILANAKWRDRPNLNNVSEYEHLIEMCDKMRAGGMSYGKLNRWLGWMQATICSWNCGVTLEDMKSINKKHADDGEKLVVVCLNDFPDGVFTSQELADAYIAEQKRLFDKANPKRHWHTHEFTQDKGAHE